MATHPCPAGWPPGASLPDGRPRIPALLDSPNSTLGEGVRFGLSSTRAHWRRRRLPCRRPPAHDQVQCGEQQQAAGGGQPPCRDPAAVAAGAPGL
eukprot:scaffold6054_cov54-Phaeocystis_antarctica.AAC.4